MKKILSLFLLALSFGSFSLLQAKDKKTDGFPEYFAQFQAAVASGDPEKVSALSSFDRFMWEAGNIPIKTKDAFIKNYTKIFTPDIQQKVAKGTPYKSSYGDYFLEWTVSDSLYALVFDHVPGGGFVFTGLSVGPN